MSINLGIAPVFTIQLADAKNVIGDTKTRSPFSQPKTLAAIFNALVPLETAKENFDLKYFDNFFSNSKVTGPCVNSLLFRTFTTALISFLSTL